MLVRRRLEDELTCAGEHSTASSMVMILSTFRIDVRADRGMHVWPGLWDSTG